MSRVDGSAFEGRSIGVVFVRLRCALRRSSLSRTPVAGRSLRAVHPVRRVISTTDPWAWCASVTANMNMLPRRLFPHGLNGFIVLSLLVCLRFAYAQPAASGTITGRVFNAATGEYVRNAEVRVQGTSLV